MSSAPLPDAGSNWVDRHAPEGLKPWLKLGRFDRPIGIWLLLIPGWQGIALALAAERRTSSLHDLWLVVGFAIGACLMRAAGCAFNDIVDRDIDVKVARTAARPVASGRISVKKALAFTVGCSLVSLLILLTLNIFAVLLGVASLALVAAYPFMKRITWWPQAWLGLVFSWGALVGWTELRPDGSPADWAALAALYAGTIAWVIGYDTIYALQDREDDALVGIRSSARAMGAHVRGGVAIFYALAVALWGLAFWLLRPDWLSLLALAPAAAHLAWQVLTLDTEDG
ncbi:4-hydroxybenzoate octaprenyltransferase, partial [Brevundimonas sp.]|uniref:4-hydroxybenzoate octaprenyltransferase n=1 Tax=Brevundimonas sp. TaxID=1871086 RepID=UPI002EDBA158